MKYINYRIHTDVEPYEIIEEISPKKVIVRSLDTEIKKSFKPETQPNNGFAYTHNNRQQEYKYTSNPNNPKSTMTLRKNGSWQFVGCPTSHSGNRGKREKKPYRFYDFNF